MKMVLKKCIVTGCFILVFPFIAATHMEGICSKNEGVFQFCAQALSLVPGILGSFLRKTYYWAVLSNASWDFHMDFGSFFAHRSASVGRGVIIGSYTIIGCAELGEEVLIASRVSITSGKNTHKNPAGEIVGNHFFSTVTIGARSWIGEGCVVMDHIGEDAIVSAGSVVTKPAPGNIVAVGNPARFIPRIPPHDQKEVRS